MDKISISNDASQNSILSESLFAKSSEEYLESINFNFIIRTPYKETENKEDFDQDNQKLIKQGYLNYLENPDNNILNLVKPFENYIILFNTMAVFSNLDNMSYYLETEKSEKFSCEKNKNLQNEVSYIETINTNSEIQGNFKQFHDREVLKFFWKANYHFQDNNHNLIWNEYDLNNQNFLNKKYKQFCKNTNQFSFNLISPCENYAVNFLKMHQFSILESWKIRPIKFERFQKDSSSYRKNLNNNKFNKLNNINLSDFKPKYSEDNEDQYYQFFYNTKEYPLNDDQQDSWEPYTKNNQDYLNFMYKKFLLDTSEHSIKLESYVVNFLTMVQYSLEDTNKINPVKIERLKNCFFWNSSKNPWDTKEEPVWSPYTLEDQSIIKTAYQIYINDNTKNIVYLKTKPNYYIDFSVMKQIKKHTENKKRPIMRGNPRLITNVVRINRFENFQNSNHINNQNNFSVIDKMKIQNRWQFLSVLDNLYKEKYKNIHTIYFNIFPEFSIKVEIEESLSLFSNNFHLDNTFEEIKSYIISEISNLGKECDCDIFEYIVEFNTMIDYRSFFTKIVYIYTLEGYLYSHLNQLLRENGKTGFQKLKYYYISLLASFYYFSSKSCLKSIINQQRDLTVFRGTRITDDELKQYEIRGMKNIIRVFNEFLSTSITKSLKSIYFDKNNENIKQIFWEIIIPEALIKEEPFNFALIFDNSDYPDENEVLLRSGAIIEIIEIIPYSEIINNQIIYYKNKFKKICILKSFNLSSFYKLISLHNSISELHLQNNKLGEDERKMMFLREAIQNQNSISYLSLSNNNLGINENNFAILKEILDKNNIINRLILNNNKIGENIKNMEFLKEIIVNNHSISYLGLQNNNLGQNEKNLMFLKDSIEENKKISYLSLGRNNLGGNINNMRHLQKALEKNNSISKLGLGANNIGEKVENMKLLKEILEKNKSITELFLFENNLGKNIENINILKEGLIKNTSIFNLAIGYNNLGGNENNLKILKEILEKNKSISNLGLQFNNLGDKENNMKYLKEGLEINTTIINLDLSSNNLMQNEKNFIFLKEIIENKNAIAELSLRNNNFGVKERNILIELCDNKNIKINI